jgi:glucose uptake protein
MILPQTYGVALTLLILSALCFGLWANTYKVTGKWRFELYYFDFAFGLALTAAILAFSVGNIGYDGFSFVDDLLHAGKRPVFYSFLAGVIFNFANMLFVAAISVTGMAVAFPVGLTLALVIGIVASYVSNPGGNATLLAAGIVLLLTAAVVSMLTYRYISVTRHEELAKSGRAKTTRRPTPKKGLVLALVSAIAMGSFFPLIQNARQGDMGLGPYAIVAVFAIGVLLSTFVFNLFFMNLPVDGPPLEFTEYFDGRLKTHLMGFAGGAMWCLGAAGALVAAAAPDTVIIESSIRYALGFTPVLIAAVCGIFLWNEFRGGDARIKSLLALMFVLFVFGAAMVSLAPLFIRKI